MLAPCRWFLPLLILPVVTGRVEGQARPVEIDTVRVEVDSRAAPDLGALTRSVQVIDRNEIRTLGATSVADVLAWASGVDFMPRSPALVDLGIRGSSFEQVLVLVDGVRMRDAQTGHFNLNLTVPLEQVERIEVLRGPASALYGSDAVGGVINIVTRRAGGSTSARFAAGTFDSFDGQLAHRGTIGGAVVDAATVYQRSDGHRPGTDFEMVSARGAVALPVRGAPLSLETGYSMRDFGADGFYGSYPSFEATRTLTASARLPLRFGEGGSVEPIIHVRRNSDDFILVRDNPGLYRNRHRTDQVGGDLLGRWAFTPLLRVAAGLHAIEDRIESRTLGDRDEWTTALSAEAAVGTPEIAVVTLGLRADRWAGGDVVLSPAASLAWIPTDRARLRTSFGRSFRTPTWTERYYRDPAHTGNPELAPERAWSLDAGADLFPIPGVEVAATGFLRDATRLIDWARRVDGEPWVTRNVDEARFAGVEAEVRVRDLLGTSLRAQGTWLSLTSSAVEGYQSKYALRPLAESVSLTAARRIPSGAQASLRGVRERRMGEESYLRVDARTIYDVGRFTVALDLKNALDERYEDISFHPAPGRSIACSVEWRTGE
jgi:vitamin B12 transporter